MQWASLTSKRVLSLFLRHPGVVESVPHQVYSQDFQDQVIPSQETKQNCPNPPMDLDEN